MREQAPSRGEAPLRAIVVDDDALARRVIADVLRQAGTIVVAEAADGTEGVELVRYHRPDLVVMDVVMPGVDGIAATRRILRDRPEQVVILLTSSGDDDLGMLGLRMGAAGYLSKEVDLAALPRAIEGALHGEAAISRTMARRVIEQLRRVPPPGRGLRPVHSPLSTREWEVLDLICDGRTTDEIADALVITTDTVRSHAKSILHKLGVKSRKEAAAAATRMRNVDV
jgi:two-component system, NarL family, response regulator LiaR